MASLELRSGKFRIVFRYAGQKFSRSLKTDEPKAAKACLARLEDNLRRLELGTLELPPSSDVTTFLLSDGRYSEKPRLQESLTLKELFDAYFASLPLGSLEQVTIDGMETHQRHLMRLLGEKFPVRTLNLGCLQEYVDQRAKEKGRRDKPVTATTVKKALVTFRTVWNWAVQHKLVAGSFPQKGLKYPKSHEKPPFQTFAEIESQVAGLAEAEAADLWECLFLTLPELADVLEYVARAARQPFIHPLFVFAAHTGARRSEILRSKLTDINFHRNIITIHERKKAHDRTTTRRVPMSPLLSKVLQQWIAEHPGGDATFCHSLTVQRSKSHRVRVQPLTKDEIHDHFKRTLAGSKWDKLRGWHLFRHSFCSNCAAAGIDQRVINGWVGHQTEEMVRRYRHLIPDQQQASLQQVFNGTG